MYNVDFREGAFVGEPTIAKLEGNGICCGDTFNLSYTGLSSSGFTIVAVRSDTQSGWGQKIKVDYEVADGGAAVLETRTVTLNRPMGEGGGYGLEVVENLGSKDEPQGVRVRVQAGGVAATSGLVLDGDKVLAINSASMRTAEYDAVVEALNAAGSVTLILTPDATPMEAVADAVVAKDEL